MPSFGTMWWRKWGCSAERCDVGYGGTMWCRLSASSAERFTDAIAPSSSLAPSVSLSPKLRVTSAQTEHMPMYLRTFLRVLSSWVHSLHLYTSVHLLGKRPILRRSMRLRLTSRRRWSRGSSRDAKRLVEATSSRKVWKRVAAGRRPERTRSGPPRREVRREDRCPRVRRLISPCDLH